MTLFGHFDFTYEPGTIQKRIELEIGTVLRDTVALIGYCKVEQGTGSKFANPPPPRHPPKKTFPQ